MTRPPAVWLCRQLQRDVLLQLGRADAAGLAVDELRIPPHGGGDLVRNLRHLEEVGMVHCELGAAAAVVRVRLRPLGRAFVAAADLGLERRI